MTVLIEHIRVIPDCICSHSSFLHEVGTCHTTITPQMNLLEIEAVMVIPLHVMIVPLSSTGSIVTVARMNVVLADITSNFTGCCPT